MKDTIIKTIAIRKDFSGVTALDDVSFEMKEGEVHALLGENGAGKTTLVKILTRELKEDAGEIYLRDDDIRNLSVRQIQDLGLAMVPQAINLVPMFTVGMNIMLGREPVWRYLLNWKSLYAEASIHLSKITERFDVRRKVSEMSVAEQQLVSVARALARSPKLLILDEPTASLGEQETREFFSILRQLKEERISILYISHRLQEVFELADRVTVLRDGKKVGTYPISEMDEEELIRLMIGQSLKAMIPKKKVPIRQERLRVSGLCIRNRNVRDVSFAARAGEIVGIVGTLGAGKSEILHSIFGLEPFQAGEVFVDGRSFDSIGPKEAIKNGLALVPEERRDALVMDTSIAHNITLASLRSVCSVGGWISRPIEERTAMDYKNRLSIATPSVQQHVGFLSGGNQQKTVISRWLNTGAKVYLFDEPTKGIDVGAKSEIYELVGELVNNGATVVYATNEIDEALGLCDNLIVLHRGQIAAVLKCSETNRQELLLYMLGGKRDAK
ncbi:MAG: sugar ABC transporter ATP-binding protein [Desulfobacterales bacterium]|nr:MAG: sugar ABC transporter ATP-binding protein [Desulfobacterales bacterium]